MFHDRITSSFNIANLKSAIFHFRTFGFSGLIRKTVDYLAFTQGYHIWRSKHVLSIDVLDMQRKTAFSYMPKISIIVPTFHTPKLFLQQMIDSVISQTYTNWELCIADGSIDFDTVATTVKSYQKDYPSILFTSLPKNLGISGNTNAALQMATGDYVALLDHDDLLSPNALYEIVKALNQDSKIDVLYSDEDKTDLSLNNYYAPYFKPDFNLDLLRSCNYITHFFVVRRSITTQIHGFSSECDGSQDYDFILKTTELARKIKHIPQVLYHWRIHPNSVAGDPNSKKYAYDSAILALKNHLKRSSEHGCVTKAEQFGYYNISYPCNDNIRISIIVNHCTANFLSHLKKVTTYKNYEIVSKLSDASGEYYIFCNHLKKIETSNWIEQLLGNCLRSSIGICSGKIISPRRRVIDSGLTYTNTGQILSPFAKLYATDPGYCYQALAQRNCSVIGPFCFMIKASLFKSFRKNLTESTFEKRIYQLCEKLTTHEYLITILPSVIMITTKKSHSFPIVKEYIGKEDPYYNPNFSPKKCYRL